MSTHHESAGQGIEPSLRASFRMFEWHPHNVLLHATPRAPPRSTRFTSPRASSHNPFAAYALLRLMETWGIGRSSDRAVEYWVMASSYCCVSAAASPRCSGFCAQRCLKAKIDLSKCCLQWHARLLTYNPFRFPTGRDRFPRQFIHHLEQTLAGIQYTVDCFETFTDGTIDCNSRGRKVQSNRALRPGMLISGEEDTHIKRGGQYILSMSH